MQVYTCPGLASSRNIGDNFEVFSQTPLRLDSNPRLRAKGGLHSLRVFC
jgi:hypothetical protein